MNREEVFFIVRKKVAEISGKKEEELSETGSLMDEIDLSSVEILAMISDFEDEFNITIETDSLGDVVTLGDLEEFIYEKQK